MIIVFLEHVCLILVMYPVLPLHLYFTYTFRELQNILNNTIPQKNPTRSQAKSPFMVKSYGITGFHGEITMVFANLPKGAPGNARIWCSWNLI